MAAAVQVETYWQGKLLRLSSTVRDYAGALTNNPTVVLTITQEATGAEVLPTVVNTGSAGLYYADVALDVAGAWVLDWVSSGAVVNADSSRIYVRPLRSLQ